MANSQNIYTIMGFLLCWAVFSAITDELDTTVKKTLAALGKQFSMQKISHKSLIQHGLTEKKTLISRDVCRVSFKTLSKSESL